ncbi:unnamed protein product [Thelazia callipaeda]|uniref:Protein kinase domain-containing protein n=1 Tax=Thelazia callipaeda TaxID=103827 RepID=A0A158RC98_THECL|nr:unnamed protein product [Thelazia callipaeda]
MASLPLKLLNLSANRSLLDSLIASPAAKSSQVPAEKQVKIFVKQLLSALKCMHDRKIAHLDIRPEVILLQDDHLRLADFGQSRRLIRGKVIANITGSPEFVSPEIASGIPVTLASDLWSVGTLTYVLLSGISPFLGDNDTETIRNVMLGNFVLNIEEFASISDEAKDFVSKLLVIDPKSRLNVDEALSHPWLSEQFLESAQLTSESLREFKYKHKWLERRVFVQQTPTEPLMSTLQAPDVNVAGSALPNAVQGLARIEPHDIYDYLRIKDRVTTSLNDLREDQQRRRLLPQDKGEAPFQQSPHKQLHISTDFLEDELLPVKLVHGEHRQIEEEIANRILSDISEETSIAGSLTSREDLESLVKSSEKQSRQKKSRSKSSTPQVEGYSPDVTPPPSPFGTREDTVTPPSDHPYNAEKFRLPAQSYDPNIPVGAPLFLEGLEHHPLHFEEVSPSVESSSYHSLPGSKSLISFPSGKEYSMEVVIGTKVGTMGTVEPMLETVKETEKSSEKEPEALKAKEKVHVDDFDSFMNSIKELKEKRRREREEMERLRPKDASTMDSDFSKKKSSDEDFPWRSQYQIGPETFLLASRGARFNARVRDYRRELWGDGAPFVTQGYLGYRNQDITVRERRRYTDLIREDENIAKAAQNLECEISSRGAIRRIENDITFGAIFRNRLKDRALQKNVPSVITFECSVVGNPEPTVKWFCNNSPLVNDENHKITIEDGLCQLTINKVDLVDLGEYTCVASNELATDKTSARLLAGDGPAPPGRPEVELSSDTEVFITWEEPRMNYGLECFIYKLEVRPAGRNDIFSEWRLVSDKIEDKAAIVQHLTPQGVYQFRVIAKNEFGWGTPSVTSRIIQTHPKNSPKLDIDKLRCRYRVCVVSKPPRTQLVSRLRSLGEITEEDEEKLEQNVAKTPILALNTTEEPRGRFQLMDLIPRGRFGQIMIAIDKFREFGLHCIAKIRDLNVANGCIEFEALRDCQQENVVRLIAAYQINNSLLLFMERYEEDLFERFTYRDEYNEEQISRVIVQIASALHWIHYKGYIHMDVQATNVLLVSHQSWQIRLTDFASAQRVSSDIKQPKQLSLYWSAPEVLKADEKKIAVSTQADVWGLGVIAFCLLSGFHPFAMEGDSSDEIKANIINQKCNPNLIHIQATQESLRFVTWALKKDPMRRIRTDEALTHRWLSNDSTLIRKREKVNYPSSRLRKTALLLADFTKRQASNSVYQESNQPACS